MHFGNPLQEISMNNYRNLLLLPLLFTPAIGVAAEAHVHGSATLQIAVDGNTLQLAFSSPLVNLLGFEHQPRTDKQKRAVHNMAKTLAHAERIFLPSPTALCTLQTVKLDSVVLEKASADAHEEHTHAGHDHADLDGDFTFVCAKPAELHELEVNLFADFPLLKKLNVEAVTQNSQVAATLNPSNTRMVWK